MAGAGARGRPQPVSLAGLFRFASGRDRACMAAGAAAACAHGALVPLAIVTVGSIFARLGDADGARAPGVARDVARLAQTLLAIGAVAFVTSFLQVRLQMAAAIRTCMRIRTLYFESLMRRDLSWHDTEKSGELTSRLASDVDLIQRGISHEFAVAVQSITAGIVSVCVAFLYSWRITLVLLALAPVLATIIAIHTRVTARSTFEGQRAFGAASAIASEVITLIRTVHAFGGQDEESKRYEKELDSAYASRVKTGFCNGFALGLYYCVVFFGYSLTFWYGDHLVRNENIDQHSFYVAFLCILKGIFELGTSSPSFAALGAARGAAPRVYQVIDGMYETNAREAEGIILEENSVRGAISFRNVTFSYGDRMAEDAKPVLEGLNLDIEPGVTHALVGASGCSKSSVAKLVERFYTPQEGEVMLDGIDISTLNVVWLRAQIGLVGQMPMLFHGTIRQNIEFGAGMVFDGGTCSRESVSDEQIVEAAKTANAHDFIVQLPEGYDTKVIGHGELLSGGQKQRICIARALVRNPPILILDEATSSLDSASERAVQEALERASRGRTSILIAHRLSTVRNANTISVIRNGGIVESGTHDELFARSDSFYHELIQLQNASPKKNLDFSTDSATAIREDDTDVNTTNSGCVAQVLSKHDGVGEVKVNADEGVDPGVIMRSLKFNSDEWLFMILGCLGGVIAGSAWPLSALPFSELIARLGKDGSEKEIRYWSLIYLIPGLLSLLGSMLQMGMLSISGERFERKLRSGMFRAVLRQEVAYFDLELNSVGALSLLLATDASYANGLCGKTMGTISFVATTLVIGIIQPFMWCWRLALVVLCTFPLGIFTARYQLKQLTGLDISEKEECVTSSDVASQSVGNVLTVFSFGLEDVFIDRYIRALDHPVKIGLKGAAVTAIRFGFAELFMFASGALWLWVGSIFIENDFCTFSEGLKAISSVYIAGRKLSDLNMIVPDIAASQVSATRSFRMLDRKSRIDPNLPGKSVASISNEMSVVDGKFEYPARPNVPILRGLSLSVASGKTLALVGRSGCGKSTIVALFERFYDLHGG